jgi:hypothetical protein
MLKNTIWWIIVYWWAFYLYCSAIKLGRVYWKNAILWIWVDWVNIYLYCSTTIFNRIVLK